MPTSSSLIAPSLIESLERATIAAVPPDTVDALPGWLLPLDSGTVGRAHSAVPLSHDAPAPGALAQIEARYAAQGLPPVFRLPADLPAFDGFTAALRERGYTRTQPVLVMQGSAQRMAEAGERAGVQVDGEPQPDWSRVYLGEGFDAADGAHRVRLLARAADCVYLSQRVPPGEAGEGSVAAVGCACFAQGWVGVHGMRTRPMYRGRGYARRLLAAMGHAARERGIERAFLQVEVENQLARGLYARVGFTPLWTYVYWRKPAARAADRP